MNPKPNPIRQMLHKQILEVKGQIEEIKEQMAHLDYPVTLPEEKKEK
ncbi:MAG: hypothetical protein H0W89_01005 [Candidatus Levybacteria bacterium]|nr:hypothetical protein [Candidatus Levybacteria bacterium]